MNNYSRNDVLQISEYLHLCMVKAIDTALTQRSGAGWFAEFKEIDSKNEKHILEKHYTSVHSMDLQSCFKFFKFSEDYAKIVFEYYGNNFYLQNQDAQKAEKQLQYLLNNLMNNVRNEVYAHASASMIENGTSSSVRYSVYGYNEAVNDMLKFASFFKQVSDSDGVPFYQKMLSVTNVKSSYSIANTIKKENLKTDTGTFVTACNSLGIAITTSPSGELLFVSSNYAGDLAQITLLLNRKQSKKSKTAIIVIAIAAIALAGVIALFAILSAKSNNDGNKPAATQSQNQVATTATEQPSVEQTQPVAETTAEKNRMVGEETYQGLTFSVDQEHDDCITIEYDNESNRFKFGWVAPAVFTVETESGDHLSVQYNSGADYIEPYSSGQIVLYFDDLEEHIVSISCGGLNLLDSRSLPSNGSVTVTIPIEYQ